MNIQSRTPPPVRPGPVRTEEEAGFREEASFFGRGTKIFGFSHLPTSPPVLGVVICSPLHAESIANYRREVLLARALASRGIAAQRFHYRGTGNSSGDPARLTFSTMRNDALEAARLLRRQGVRRVAFLGTRWGALVAGAAASRFHGSPLIVWEPVVQANHYFRDVARIKRIYDLRRGAPLSSDPQLEELFAGATLDVVGYSIGRRLYETSAERTLVDELGPYPRHVLIIQVGGAETLREDLAELAASWRKGKLAVETQLLREEESWWFVLPPEAAGETASEGRSLVSVTVDRLERWGTEQAASS